MALLHHRRQTTQEMAAKATALANGPDGSGQVSNADRLLATALPSWNDI